MPYTTPPLDPLVPLDACKGRLGITGKNEDTLLNFLLAQISRQLITALNRTCLLALNPAQPLVETLNGYDTPWVWCRHWPIQAPLLPGNCTQGSAVVTSLPSTAALFAGQPVTGANVPTPPVGSSLTAPNIVINSIDSPTQVTLSAPCSATATQTLFDFGPIVWQDDNANWGSAPGAFGAGTLLTYGVNYAVDRDQPDGSSYSGLVCRLDSVWGQTWRWVGGGLVQPRQMAGLGNIRVMMRAGFMSCPEDIQNAVIKAVARERNSKQYGQALSSENYDGYGYNLKSADDKTGLGILDGEIASILAKYQRQQISGI